MGSTVNPKAGDPGRHWLAAPAPGVSPCQTSRPTDSPAKTVYSVYFRPTFSYCMATVCIAVKQWEATHPLFAWCFFFWEGARALDHKAEETCKGSRSVRASSPTTDEAFLVQRALGATVLGADTAKPAALLRYRLLLPAKAKVGSGSSSIFVKAVVQVTKTTKHTAKASEVTGYFILGAQWQAQQDCV